jgi:hypothetical protein
MTYQTTTKQIKYDGHREPLYYKGWVTQERDWDPSYHCATTSTAKCQRERTDTTRKSEDCGPAKEQYIDTRLLCSHADPPGNRKIYMKKPKDCSTTQHLSWYSCDPLGQELSVLVILILLCCLLYSGWRLQHYDTGRLYTAPRSTAEPWFCIRYQVCLKFN